MALYLSYKLNNPSRIAMRAAAKWYEEDKRRALVRTDL